MVAGIRLSPSRLAALQSKLTGLSDAAKARTKFRMMRAFLPTFAKEVLRGPPEYEGKYLLGPHHIDWGKAVNQHSRILALAARDHGKSFFFIFAYALWMASIRAPGREGYLFSATDRQAKEHLKKIRDEVVGTGAKPANPKLAHLLPLKKDNENEIVFANGSCIKARGFGSKVRGGHPFWAVGDDMLNDEHIYSETVREKGIDYFLSAIEPMVVPGGQLIVVGTPFHAEDLYAHLERSGEYHVMKHPAVDPVTGAALWPSRYDERALGRKKRLLASNLRWSREFLCQPISDDSSIFPSWLFEQPTIKQPYPLGLPPKHWKDQGFTCYMGVDLAISTSANADYFICFVIAVCPVTSDYWVVDIQRGQGMGYQTQVDTIVSLGKAYDCQFVFCESNQFQRVISDMVVRSSDVPIVAFYTTGKGGSTQVTTRHKGMAGEYSANKNALDRGVPGLRMLLENKKLRIPWAEETRERVEVWLKEMGSFAFVQGKMQGVGAHDDTVMAFWMAERAAKHGGGFGVYFGEGEEQAHSDGLIPTPMGRVAVLPGSDELTGTSIYEAEPEEEAEPDFFGGLGAPRMLPGMAHVVGGAPPWYNGD